MLQKYQQCWLNIVNNVKIEIVKSAKLGKSGKSAKLAQYLKDQFLALFVIADLNRFKKSLLGGTNQESWPIMLDMATRIMSEATRGEYFNVDEGNDVGSC